MREVERYWLDGRGAGWCSDWGLHGSAGGLKHPYGQDLNPSAVLLFDSCARHRLSTLSTMLEHKYPLVDVVPEHSGPKGR